MNQTEIEELIRKLDDQSDGDNLLDAVRAGIFDPQKGQEFLELLRSISIDDDDLVPKRLLSIMWCLPLFLEWQKERVAEKSPAESAAYNKFVTNVMNVLFEVLGTL